MEMELTTLKCNKCHHSWVPRRDALPAVCPRCKRFDWNDKKRSKSPIIYIMANYGPDKLFKVGCTSDLMGRYPSKSSRDNIVATKPVPKSIHIVEAERAIHALFNAKRMGRMELFDLSPEDIETFKNYKFQQ